MKRIDWVVLCGLMVLAIVGCSPAEPAPTQQPAAKLEELRFQDEATGRRFQGLDACIQKLADGTWQTKGYQRLGNFQTGKWCTGQGARSDCQIAEGTLDQRDQEAIELYTLFYEQSYPEVFGLGLHALRVPKDKGWGVGFSFAEQGQRVVGEGWSVTFRDYETESGAAQESLSLGWTPSYSIPGLKQTVFALPAEGSLREDLGQYLASAEAMRERGLARNEELRKQVVQALQAHQVETCDKGPDKGNGTPPECTPRAMRADEEAAELAKAQAFFDGQAQLLEAHSQELYAAWMAAFPLDTCWP